MTPYSPLSLLEAVRLTGEEAKVQRRVYGFARSWQPTRFAAQIAPDRAREYHQADAGHDVMSDQFPQLLSTLQKLD